MSAPLSFLDIDGGEVVNSYRTMSYLQRGLGAVKWTAASLGCEVLSREVGGVAPFVSPSADPAPWYDASVAESAEFLGLVLTSIDFLTTDTKRSIAQLIGGVGGGTLGFAQLAAKGVTCAGLLIASSCPGLEYGRHWITAQLGDASLVTCPTFTLRVRDSCPPTNGSNDTRGEFIIYDAGLVDGIHRTSPPEELCCDYDAIAFTLAGKSPFLFKRPGAATTPVEIANIGGALITIPASGVSIVSPIIYIVGTSVTNAVRVQLTQYPPMVSQIDEFGANSIPTRWYQTSALYTISSGKLRPAATGARLIRRSTDGTVGNIVKYAGGRVEANVKLGTTPTGGVWAVALDPLIFAGFRAATNLFVLSSTGAAGTTYDSVAFTPVASTTYRIILEALPNAAGTGWDARAWLVNQAAPTVMLTRALHATITASGILTPGIYSTAAQTTEEWDSFYAIERTSLGDGGYVDVNMPAGTLVLDASRRIAAFTPAAAADAVDGTQYLASPAGAPIYWPDSLPGEGASYVQLFGTAGTTPATTVSVAQQARQR